VERFKNNRFFFGIILVLIVLGIGVSTYSVSNKTKKESSTITNKQKEGVLGKDHEKIVYGMWSQKESIIKEFDLETGQESIVATLPLNIKKVKFISPSELIFINNTDDKDHGENISVYNISTKQLKTLVSSSGDTAIDDYVISPSKRYLATWEVAFDNNSSGLANGVSRVYSVDLQTPQIKNLIYNEIANNPVHYPRGINDNGEIFLDTFLPNTETGWANGMSMSDFRGLRKEDITAMANGTYGTQPVLSPDGTQLAFAGYNGAWGNGVEGKDGFKKATLTPNTLETYDIIRKQRIKLLDLRKSGIYTGVGWDEGSGKIVFSAISNDSNNDGLFLYNQNEKRAERINLGEKKDGGIFVTSLSSGNILISEKSNSESSVGNLGDTYSSLDTRYSVIDSTGSYYLVNTSDIFMQYIDVAPTSESLSLLAANSGKIGNSTNSATKKDVKKTLQLQTFFFKAELPKKRIDQQTKPRCVDLAKEQCKAMGFTSNLTTDPNNMNQCITKQRQANYSAKGEDGRNICMDSPLYLYAEKGKEIQVKINTKIYSSNPIYPENGFNIVMDDNNKMLIGGNSYDKLDYDYTSSLKTLMPPNTGTVVKREELNKTLERYGNMLGFNSQEIEDLVSYGKEKISSPYVFVSFFNQEKSKQILPITFNPKPDTYINYVFYFKQLKNAPKFKIDEPSFSKTERKGFTAVEISGIVE
jgi:hypothetical protein